MVKLFCVHNLNYATKRYTYISFTAGKLCIITHKDVEGFNWCRKKKPAVRAWVIHVGVKEPEGEEFEYSGEFLHVEC